MSDILNELLSKVSALTTTVNQLLSGSKSIPELPTQTTLDATSLLPVSRNGVSEKITVQQIVNAAVNNDNDQLITIGEITLDGNDLTIDSISGKINNVIQFISTPTVVNIPFCASGLNRIDLIVYDNANNIVRIPGTETAGSIIIAPIQPLETLLITPISVSDTVIGEPEAPIVGASYIKKSFDKIHQFSASGTDVVIPFHLYGYSTIELSGALTSVSGFSFTDLIDNPAVAEYPHDGKSLYIINRSGHDITFKNADFASLAVVFFAFDGGNIVIPNNGKLELKYTEDGLIDVLKSWTTTDDVIGLPAALGLKADLVGGKVPTEQLPSYVDDVLEYANLAAFPITGEASKIYLALDTNFTYRWTGSIYVDLNYSKLDKVSTVDVEKVYIKNADGTQSMKPTSELGGGGASGLEVLFSDAATYSFTGAAANFVVHSVLIPANTLEVGDFIQMKAFVGRSGTYTNNIIPKIYVNTVNSFSGATLVSSGLILDETSTIFQRDYFVRDTKLTSMITNFNQIKSHYNANSVFTETTINRTTDLYFMLVLYVSFASETGVCNGFIVTKSK